MSIQENIKAEIPEIFKVFAGMNDMYVNLIRMYHEIAKDTNRYTAEYINECRLSTLEAITTLKKEYVKDAIKVIQQIKEKYGEQPPTVEEPKTEQAKLLKELQRLNNLTLWRQQMEVATVDELRAMYKDNKWDNDFRTLLDVELRKRAKDPAATQLKLEIENPPKNPAFIELDRIQKGLEGLIAMNYYPENLAETGLNNLKLRSITDDLDRIMDKPAFHL